jgi:hypothetical protein
MGSTDAAASVIQQVRRALLVATAAGAYLDAVGNNRSVPRPENTNDDELYRKVIKALAWLPKGLPLSYYALLSAVFGTQEQVKAQLGRSWKVYEVNPNELVVELPVGLITGALEFSTYLHGASGYGRVPVGPSNVFTTDFDLRLSRSTTIVGSNLYFETSPGTWTAYTISVYSFSAGVATVQVSLATLPAGGGRFSMEVPGDGVASYRGDYLATSGVSTLYSTAGGPATNTLLVIGDVTQAVRPAMTASIGINGVTSTRDVSTLSYSNATNVTTVVITTTDVPGGQTKQTFEVAQEASDTTTTPPHSDRVYLTGTGLYQVVQFYLDLLVRASGVVVRLEVI